MTRLNHKEAYFFLKQTLNLSQSCRESRASEPAQHGYRLDGTLVYLQAYLQKVAGIWSSGDKVTRAQGKRAKLHTYSNLTSGQDQRLSSLEVKFYLKTDHIGQNDSLAENEGEVVLGFFCIP